MSDTLRSPSIDAAARSRLSAGGDVTRCGWRSWLTGALLIASYLATRLFNIRAWGLHYDEATYLYWGQVIGLDWSQRYMGARWGGKEPLHAWLLAAAERAIADPVLAGRLVSVLAGALTLAAVHLLAKRLFSPRVAGVAVAFCVACPFTTYFDRVALIDGLLAAEAMWCLYLSVVLLDRQTGPRVAALALTFGAACLTKSVGHGFALLLPATWLLRERDGRARGAVRWLAAIAIAVAAGELVYYAVFGSTDAAVLVRNFPPYTFSRAELLGIPLQGWSRNVSNVARWVWLGLTPALAAAALLSLLASPWLGRPGWLLAIWVLLPTAAFVLLGKVFYDRYILLCVPPLLVLAAAGLTRVYDAAPWRAWTAAVSPGRLDPNPWLGVAALALLLVPAARANVAASRADHGWSTIYDLRDDLVARARRQPIVLLLDTSPAPVEDGLAMLLHGQPGIRVLRVEPREGRLGIIDAVRRQSVRAASLNGQTIYYAHSGKAGPGSWLDGKVTLEREYPPFATLYVPSLERGFE